MEISITNKTMDLAQCRDAWFFDEKHDCWCLEDLLYTPAAKVPQFQRLSIYAPRALMSPGGIVLPQARRVPVVFENNAAGYMQMPPSWLDGPRCGAKKYLDAGFVYVTCGCSGRESRDAEGRLVGKSPATLVDLKTAIRFLRHNRAVLPGDPERIISVGTSAGGAMSSLLGLTGDSPAYLPYLEATGAFLEESDTVYAAQIYCPIIDLAHADQAYEWMFRADKTCEDSPAGPAQTMTPFQEALSQLLSQQYIDYFNSLALKNPETGEFLRLEEDGRSGSGYDYLMAQLEASATKYLTLLAQGALPLQATPEAYLSGDYTQWVPDPTPPENADAHHAGPGVDIPRNDARPKTLGELMLRPPKGIEQPPIRPRLVQHRGTAKGQWLSWDGTHAAIRDLDSYVLNNRRRMKPCTSFDVLPGTSGENQLFGTPQRDFVHYNAAIGRALEQLRSRFPEETAALFPGYEGLQEDQDLQRRMALVDPMAFLDEASGTKAKHFRIRVGSQDADTATTISMALALKLAEAGYATVDYAIVWDQPHCDADYPGEVCQWIRKITGV